MITCRNNIRLKSTNYKNILIKRGRYHTRTRQIQVCLGKKNWIIPLLYVVFPYQRNLSSYICLWLFFCFSVCVLLVIVSLILLRTWHIFKRRIQAMKAQRQTQRANHSISLNTTRWLLRMKGNGLTGGVYLYPFGRNFLPPRFTNQHSPMEKNKITNV